MKTPIFIGGATPVFDSIIAGLVYEESKTAFHYNTPTGSNILDKGGDLKDKRLLPLWFHKDKYYLTSFMMWNQENTKESLDSWKKRFESQNARILDFGKRKKRIHSGSGFFKSYDMPISTLVTDKVWFYFKGNPKEVKRLLDNYFVGLGKKTNIGFGWIDRYEIFDYTDVPEVTPFIYYRRLPKTKTTAEVVYKFFDNKFKLGYGAFKMPYWVPEFQQEIIIPLLQN